MYVFKKIKDSDNQYDNTDIEFKVDAVVLSDLIVEFENFLKASGFHFEGSLDIVEEEENVR